MPPETSPELQSPQTNINQTTPVDTNMATVSLSKPEKPSRLGFLKGKKKLLLSIVLVLVVLAGGSAAGYYAVVLPNKPDNKLLKAFTNLASQNQVTVTSKIDYQNKKSTSDVKGFTLDFDMGVDLDKSLVGLSGKIGVSGAQYPLELRYIDKDIYLKIGGLGSIDKLLPPSSSYSEYTQTLTALNDQWFVIDRSFLQQAGASANCVSDLSFALNDSDVDKIRSAYKKHPLFKVKSTSNQKVDGVDTIKMELEPASDETAGNFANELNSLSVVSKVKACLEDVGVDAKGDSEVKPGKTSSLNSNERVSAFVTRDKKLKRLLITSDNNDQKTTMTMDFSDKAVSVTKPEGAKPIQDLLGSLLGGFYGPDLLNVQGLNSLGQ